MKIITINSKLHGQKEIFVDDEDYEELNQHKWAVVKALNTFYAIRSSSRKIKPRINFKMHKVVMGLKPNDGYLIDHIDHNGLNNQKRNLRFATVSQNSRNKRSYKNSTSKYLGVSWDKIKQKWRANIQINKKTFNLGSFINENDAASAYNNKAKEHFKEFANLNKII